MSPGGTPYEHSLSEPGSKLETELAETTLVSESSQKCKAERFK